MLSRPRGLKILVISLAGIGDTLIATPLFRELRLNFPEAQIEALVFWNGARELLSGNPHLDRVIQRNLVEVGPVGAVRFLLGLRREAYDITVNTHPQSRIHYRLAAWLIGARVRVSHEYDHHSVLDRQLITHSIPQDYGVHSIENNLRLLPLMGAEARSVEKGFELVLNAGEKTWASEFVAQAGLRDSRWIGLHAGSGTTKNLRFKRWPLRNHAGLIARMLAADPQLRVVLFGGPDEEAENRELLSQARSPRVLAARSPSVRHAAALLGLCPVFVSVDNLMMHLAAAMKVPTQILIESPTYGLTLAPYQRPFILVPNPVAHGRNLDFYRYDGGPIRGTPQALVQCMESVTVDAVYEALMMSMKPCGNTSVARIG